MERLDMDDLKYRPYLGITNITLSFCDIIEGKSNTIPVFKTFYLNNVVRYGNAKCPFEVIIPLFLYLMFILVLKL